jgi:putative membrane protein insertion efficiency factor
MAVVISAPTAGHQPTRVTRALVALVQTYQVVRGNRVSPCRFTPTCSQYAVEALSRHGTRHGLRLTASRLGRCRPRGPFGADPVPE